MESKASSSRCGSDKSCKPRFTVRPEQDGDVGAIRDVVTAAFGRDAEALLVDALRRRGDTLVSLVAVATPVASGDSTTGVANEAAAGAGAAGAVPTLA